jgi:hypothetical protein
MAVHEWTAESVNPVIEKVCGDGGLRWYETCQIWMEESKICIDKYEKPYVVGGIVNRD